MIALTPIVERLRAAGCRHAEGVLEMAALDASPRQLPFHHVVPTGEGARPNANAGARDQAVDAGFSVMVTVDGQRRHRDGVSEELRDAINRVVDAITGWTHPEASRACDFAGGRLASASGSTVTWEVRFTTRYHLRKAS